MPDMNGGCALHERMVFARYGSREADIEHDRRGRTEFEIEIPVLEFEADEAYYSDKYSIVVARDESTVKLRRTKPDWETFEDKVWRMFYKIHTEDLPVRRTVIEYGKHLTKQVDGLFADAAHVYVVECKYRGLKGGQPRKDNSLRGEVQQWKGILPEIQLSLQKREEFRGKQVHFILATRGVEIDEQLRNEGKGVVYFLDDTTISQILDLGAKVGRGGLAVLHQYLFRGKEIPGKPQEFPALRLRIGPKHVFGFFANADQLIDLAYVHRREPSNADLSTAYQRLIRPEKVAKISAYLSRPGSFFANAIVVSLEKAFFRTFGSTEDATTWGSLILPNVYGSVWIIDGQHRLYGSAASEDNRKKHFPVIAVEGLSASEQGELFRTINENQTKIPPDLIWDMYGDSASEKEPLTDDEKEGYRKRTISNVWKRINQSKDHPMAGKIIIPSQTIKSKECFIQFAYLCDMLNFQDLWSEGKLRGDSWTTAENYAFNRVNAFLRGLAKNLPDEWQKGKEGWLLQQYSLRVILQVFRYGVIMFSEAKYSPRWKSSYDDLLEEFSGNLAQVMKKPTVHYSSSVRRAGNAQQRTEIVRRLVKELKDSYSTLAPNFETEIGEDTGDEPTAEEYFRSRNLEIRFRDCVFSVLHTSQGENWFTKVPEKTQRKIEDDVILRKAHGEEDLEAKPTRGWLDSSTLSDLFLIITDDKNWPLFKDYMSGAKKVFEQYFSDWMLLRNIITHGKTFPSKIAKTRCLAALEYFEELQVRFP